MYDEAYKKWNEALIPTQYEMLGIRVPQLRAKAKELIRQGEYEAFLQQAPRYFEDIQLRAFVIADCPISIKARMDYVEQLLPLADNWAVIDGLCSSLKEAKQHRESYWTWLQTLRKKEAPFTRRFVIVMYLTYFLTDDYIDDVLQQLGDEAIDHYYVKMAVAWALSIAFVKQREKTLAFLHNTSMPVWTYNKALQKTRESLRVTKEDKAMLQRMKK